MQILDNSNANNTKCLIQKKSCVKLCRHLSVLNWKGWFLGNSQHEKQNNRDNLWRSDSTWAKNLWSVCFALPPLLFLHKSLSRRAPPLLGMSSPSKSTLAEILPILKGSTSMPQFPSIFPSAANLELSSFLTLSYSAPLLQHFII